MKNWIYILMIGLMSCLVSSCQQSLDEDVKVPLASGKAQISFTIVLDDHGSRSAWQENETANESEMGTDMENQINLDAENGLQVFVYDLTGNILGEVTDKEIRQISVNEYSFNGRFTIQNLNTNTLDCRLMVYANCINSNATFNYNVNYIPMWGVKKTTLLLAKGELTELNEPVYLLRSMAKVEVKLDNQIADDFNLTSVSIDKYNAVGNVEPSYEALVDTEAMDAVSVFNHNTTTLGTNLPFTKISDDEYHVYLPEYDNGNPASISVLVENNSQPYTIEFKNYENGKPTGSAYNIIRNHIYRYTISSIGTEVLVNSLLYQSMPWNDVNNKDLTFGNPSGDAMN